MRAASAHGPARPSGARTRSAAAPAARSALRHQHRGAGDEAVDHDHAALARGLQHRADQRGDLEAAEGRQRIQRRACASACASQHAAQHAALARQAGVVQPGAARRRSRRGRSPASRASSSDAAEVLPMPISPSSSALPGRPRTTSRPLAMACSHCAARHRRARATRRRCRARPCGSAGPARGAKSCAHAAVHHRQRQAVLARQHAHRRAAGQEVLAPSARSRRSDRPTRRAPPGRGRRRTPAAAAASQRGRLGAQDQADAAAPAPRAGPSEPSGLVLRSSACCRRAASAASSDVGIDGSQRRS